MQLTKSKYEVHPAPKATDTFICSSYLDSDSIKTEFQCKSINEVEILLGATAQASLTYLSPFRLIFICIKYVLQNELAKYQTILAEFFSLQM